MADSSQKLVIRNIGRILSGKLEQPLIDGNCVIAIDGVITAIGDAAALDIDQADVTVDANDTWSVSYTHLTLPTIYSV